jgi:hypothetical protein
MISNGNIKNIIKEVKMKNTKLFLLILLLITISTAISQEKLPKPFTEEWNKLPVDLRREACKIPNEILPQLSTDNLIEKCLNYEFMSDVLFWDNFKPGLLAVTSDFNGLQELFKRKDAAAKIFNYYKNIDPNYIEGIENLKDQGAFIHKIIYLELYLSHPDILNQLKGKETTIIEEILNKFDKCNELNINKKEKIYAGFALKTKGLVLASLLDKLNNEVITEMKKSNSNVSYMIDKLCLSKMSDELLINIINNSRNY